MQEALKKLFADHYQDVYVYLYSLCHDALLAEDLASETFLEAVKSIARFRGDSDLKTWLFAIARHRWSACLRRKKRSVQEEALTDFYGSPGPEEARTAPWRREFAPFWTRSRNGPGTLS